MDICIIVGHTPRAPGAVSAGGVAEFAYNERVARELVAGLAGTSAGIVYRGLPNDLEGLPAKVNATGARLAIELHFNSHANASANGTEMLFWHTSVKGLRFATLLQTETVRALGTRDRGVKPISGRERGGVLLQKTRMPCVIAEPFFGSNPDDWARGSKMRGSLVIAYARAIRQMLCATMVAEV